MTLSQEHRHVDRQVDDAVLDLQVLRVKNERLTQPIAELRAELIKRGRQGDILHVHANRDERTRFDVVIAPVRDQCLDEFPRLRTSLHLVKDNERLSFMQRHLVGKGKFGEEAIRVYIDDTMVKSRF